MCVVVFPGGHIQISSTGIVYWWQSQTWCQQTKSWCVKTCWRLSLRWGSTLYGIFDYFIFLRSFISYMYKMMAMVFYKKDISAFWPNEMKSLISCLRSQTCSSLVRQRSSSEPGRSRIWRSLERISFVQPVSRFRRLFVVGCRELDTERFTRLP